MMRHLRLIALWLALSAAPAFASQATLVTPGAPLSMNGLAAFLNSAFLSVGSCNSGNSAPANGTGAAAFAGECWINTTANPWVFSYTPDGTHWVEFGTLNTLSFVWTPYSNGFSASLGGNFSTAGAFTQSGAFPVTLTATGATNSTLPVGNHTLAGLDVIQTWTATQTFPNNSLTLAEFPTIGANTVIGSIAGGTPAQLTQAQVTTLVNLATSALPGALPAWPNYTTTYFRGDGAYATLNFAALGGSAACGQLPALTGDVTTTAGSCADAIAANAVTNAKMATMNPWTIKMNNSGSSAAPTDTTIDGLTLKGSPTSSDEMPIWDAAASAMKKATVASIASAGSVASINGQTGSLNVTYAPQGRITPVSGVPVPTTDQVGITTLYYDATGVNGKQVPIYNGTNVVMVPICAANTAGTCNVSLALGSNWSANTLFDLYAYNNSGAVGICSVPWSNSGAGTSARATALQSFDGFDTNAAAITSNCRTSNTTTISVSVNQGTFLGTFLTNGNTGQVDLKFGSSAAGGGAAVFSIWNAYNQVRGSAFVQDSTASWSTATSIGPLDASGTGSGLNNRISIVAGLQQNHVSAQLIVRANTTVSNFNSYQIGLNSTSVAATRSNRGLPIILAVAATSQGGSKFDGDVGLGLNYLQALETASASGQTSTGAPDEGFFAEVMW